MSRISKTARWGSGSGIGVLVVGLGLTCAGAALAQPVVYVDAGATGANDGSSWTDAYADLQAALDAAEASGGLIREIWVANGTYKPSKRTDPDDPRSATFQLIDGVALYGGFAGSEASVDERDIDTNSTVLSGDFNGDDQPDFANYGENAYHVVTGIRVGGTTIFDGFTVTGGHTPGIRALWSYGGGMFLENAYPEIRNCTFTRNLSERPVTNVAWGGGGGAALFLYQDQYDPDLPPLSVSRSHFTDNRSVGDGGAVLIWGVYFAGSIVFSECSFERNVGDGAFTAYFGSACILRSCVFSDNSTDGPGGAVYLSSGEALIQGCRFEGNSAGRGGAVAVYGGRAVTIRESLFLDNSAPNGYAGALHVYDAHKVELIDSEFRGNSADYAGGAQLDWNGSTTVRRCQFVNNVATSSDGGGLYVRGGAQLSECDFAGNLAQEWGGGLLAAGSTLVEGCTFTGNSANEGGGVRDGGDSLTVVDSTFERNYATLGGGVLTASYRGAGFEQCRFKQNTAYIGGGVAVLGAADFFFDRCAFTYNLATIGGGLSTLDYVGSAALRSCLFAGNTGYAYGGGIAAAGGSLWVENCTVAQNRADGLGAGLIVGNDTTISNSVVWGNIVDPGGEGATDEVAQIEGIESATIDYSNVQGWSGAHAGEGNIGLDPLFVQPVYPDGRLEPGEPDFHVRPESPCINAGLTETIDWDPWDPPPPNLDLEGKPRVLCRAVDMGAYEFGVAGDVDCDRDVDNSDFTEWSACMSGPGAIAPFPDCSAFDFDGDADIDLVDFAQFVRVFSPGSP